MGKGGHGGHSHGHSHSHGHGHGFGGHRSHGFGSRRFGGGHHHSPSAYSLERAAMPISGPLGYYFPFENDKYDTTSFNPAFSNNTISQFEIEAFVGEINSIVAKAAEDNCRQCLLAFSPLLVLAVVGGCMALIFTNLDTTVSYSTGNGYIYAPSGTGISTSVAVTLAVFIGLLGISVIVFLCYYSSKTNNTRIAEITEKMNEAIQRHQNTTFAGKDVTVRISKLQSYLAIDFKNAQAAQAVNPIAALQAQQAALLLGAALA